MLSCDASQKYYEIKSIFSNLLCCYTRPDKSKNETTGSNDLLEYGNNSIEKNKFSDYLKAIPFLELPYSTSCDDDYENTPELDQKLKKKYSGEDLESPYRRIPNNQDLEVVLNLAPADVLLSRYTTKTEI